MPQDRNLMTELQALTQVFLHLLPVCCFWRIWIFLQQARKCFLYLLDLSRILFQFSQKCLEKDRWNFVRTVQKNRVTEEERSSSYKLEKNNFCSLHFNGIASFFSSSSTSQLGSQSTMDGKQLPTRSWEGNNKPCRAK